MIIPGVVAASGGAVSSMLPTRSLSFAAASGQSLSMSSANFGVFDYAKFAYSVWVKRADVTGRQGLISRGLVGVNTSIDMYFDDSYRFYMSFLNGGSVAAFTTTATYASNSWQHFLVHYDSANATANSRMRMWRNGTEVTSVAGRTNPTTSVSASADTWSIGVPVNAGGSYDGLFLQPAFFSGVLPDVADLRDTVTGLPKDITGALGLYSLLNTNASDALEDDYKLSANWTNNNAVIKSTTIPA